MEIAITILFAFTLAGIWFVTPIIRAHLKDIDDELHQLDQDIKINHDQLKTLTENLDEFEFERGLKKWHHMGSRSRNKYIAEHYLGWANLGNEWHDRNGEVYDEPSDFEGENFSKFVHEVKLSDKDRQFLLYCILWQKGFKL